MKILLFVNSWNRLWNAHMKLQIHIHFLINCLFEYIQQIGFIVMIAHVAGNQVIIFMYNLRVILKDQRATTQKQAILSVSAAEDKKGAIKTKSVHSEMV